MNHDHKLVPLPNPLEPKLFRCSCGKWEIERPKIGVYGRTTPRAIFGRVTGAHLMHLHSARAKEVQ